MLEQQPEELAACQGLDHLLTLVGLDAKGNLSIFVRKDVFFWQDATIQLAAKIDEGFFPLTNRLAIHHPLIGHGAVHLQSETSHAIDAFGTTYLGKIFSGKRT
jgi:hypothetical protein